jgi:hypothetical protein
MAVIARAIRGHMGLNAPRHWLETRGYVGCVRLAEEPCSPVSPLLATGVRARPVLGPITRVPVSALRLPSGPVAQLVRAADS